MSTKTVQVQAHVFMGQHYTKDYSGMEWTPEIWRSKVAEDERTVYIGEQTVTVEVPDDFDPVPKQVAALEAEKRAAMAEYQQKVADINERLSKLQAIEYAP